VLVNRFLVLSAPGSLLFVDISHVDQAASSVPLVHFDSWHAAEKYFLSRGAPKETLDAAAEALKNSDVAKLTF